MWAGGRSGMHGFEGLQVSWNFEALLGLGGNGNVLTNKLK